MTAPQAFDLTECICHNCDATFKVPVLGKCPCCGSRFIGIAKPTAVRS